MLIYVLFDLIKIFQQYNASHRHPSQSVEVVSHNGICSDHKLSLPVALCNLRAVLLSLQRKIIVCGWRNCEDHPDQPSVERLGAIEK